jgi:hypothetical protein
VPEITIDFAPQKPAIGRSKAWQIAVTKFLRKTVASCWTFGAFITGTDADTDDLNLPPLTAGNVAVLRDYRPLMRKQSPKAAIRTQLTRE